MSAIILTVVVLLGAGIAYFLQTKTPSKEASELKKLQEDLQQKGPIMKREYDAVISYFRSLTNYDKLINIRFMKKSSAIIGSSRSGKTTFAWMIGLSDKPTYTSKHHTVKFNTQGSKIWQITDTIGCPISEQNLYKLISMCIIKGIVPSTIISANGESIGNDEKIFEKFDIKNPFCFSIIPENIYKTNSGLKYIYNSNSYNESFYNNDENEDVIKIKTIADLVDNENFKQSIIKILNLQKNFLSDSYLLEVEDWSRFNYASHSHKFYILKMICLILHNKLDDFSVIHMGDTLYNSEFMKS
jgi:hypothetical protein